MTPPKSVPGRAGPTPPAARERRPGGAVGVSPRHAGASKFAPRGAATEEGEPMAPAKLRISSGARPSVPTPSAHALRRRRPLKHRLILTVIGLAIVLLALSGWVAQAIRLAR
jgi:hypothetical protein